jgi:hypothetical protein
MLKTVYATREEIPEGYDALYTERNGQWELTGITGVKTEADIARIQAALVKERNDHKATRTSLSAFEGLDPEVVSAQAIELEETKAQLAAIKNDGTIDETKLEPIIAARVAQRIAPLERDLRGVNAKLLDKDKLLAAKDGEVGQLRTTIVTGNVERAIRDAAIEAKLLPTAVVDAVMHGRATFEVTEDGRIITKDGSGATPGLSPKEWLKDMQEKAPHWWAPSVGGGSAGGGGGGPKGTYGGANNPWSAAGWNMTKQGALVRQLGEPKAAEIAAQAGSKIGATHPTKAA